MGGVLVVLTVLLARIVVGVNIVTVAVLVAFAPEVNRKEILQVLPLRSTRQVAPVPLRQANARQSRSKGHSVAEMHDQEDIAGSMEDNNCLQFNFWRVIIEEGLGFYLLIN